MNSTKRQQKSCVLNCIAAILLSTALSFVTIASAETPTEKLEIGALLPLTGKDVRQGEMCRRGIELAMEESSINRLVNVTFEDTWGVGAGGPTAFKKLRNAKDIGAAVGISSPVMMAVAPLVNRERVPLLAIVAAPGYSSPDDFTFRVNPSATAEAEFIGSILTKDGAKKKISLFYSESDYGEGYRKPLEKIFSAAGITITEYSFLPESTDFRPQLLRIKKEAPDVLLLAALGPDAGLILKQAGELHYKPPQAIGFQACENPDLITMSHGQLEGFHLVAPTAVVTPAFLENYQARFKEPPTFIVVRMFDSIRLLATAFSKCKQAGDVSECMRTKLAAVHDFEGTSFPITFDQNGDIKDRLALKRVVNGAFVED